MLILQQKVIINMKIVFILPGRGWADGIRPTVIMSNGLLESRSSSAMNRVRSKTKAELVGKLDNDCLVTPGWTRTLAWAQF